ncbi:MAG: DUF3048 domain-containing protein [Eubacteriales bacterium]
MKEHKNLRLLRILSILAVFAMLLSVVGCDFSFGLATDTTSGEENGDETTGKPASTTATPESSKNPDGTQDPNGTEVPSESTTTPPETDPDGNIITYIDPLTGLRSTVNRTGVRPVSIFFDNVSAAAPQSGISKMDILIETVVEGGITRLVGITNDYIGADGKGTKDVYGPIRSARPYMVSLSQAFGALMVGAGGSPQGYELIRNLGLDYLDNERDRYAGLCFYRDVDRLNGIGYEHSLMATGMGIELLAQQNSYSLTQNTKSAFNFIDEDKTMYLGGGSAAHVIIKYSLYQQVQLVYSKTTGMYYRYQNGDVAHYDAENGEQLNFKNVLILFADTSNIPGDTEGRLDIQTTGSGEGYYISDGRYAPIKWSRASDTSELVITGAAGEKLTINRGKTFISIVNSSLKGTSSIELNFKVGN